MFLFTERKRKFLLIGFLFATATVMNSSSYTMASKSVTEDLSTSNLAFTSGSTSFLVGVAIAPLASSPTSEGENEVSEGESVSKSQNRCVI